MGLRRPLFLERASAALMRSEIIFRSCSASGRCGAAAGLMVQGEMFMPRCSKCNWPGSGSMLTRIADQLQSHYKAILLSKDSQEISVVAEGIGTDIVPQVLAATAHGQFVWMKPTDAPSADT
jgi:hypothetical protein